MKKKYSIGNIISASIVSIALVLVGAIMAFPAVSQVTGLAVAQSATLWNSVIDAAKGDSQSTGILGMSPYLYNGLTFDRLRGDTTNGLDVDVTRMPTDPFGANSDAASTTGSYAAKLRWLAEAVRLEDAAETAGTGLAMMGSVRRDTAASSAGTTGDNATINTDANGLLWTRTADACSSGAKTSIAISINTATTTEITPSLAGASNNYYVCSIDLLTAAANNVALVDDNNDNCTSVDSGMAGGTTAATGWNFGANGGIAKGNGMGMVYKTNGTNRVICIITSAATQLSGSIQVIAAP